MNKLIVGLILVLLLIAIEVYNTGEKAVISYLNESVNYYDTIILK